MRLVTYSADGAPRAGVIAADGTVVDARDLVRDAPDDTLEIIAAGEATWRALGDAAAAASTSPSRAASGTFLDTRSRTMSRCATCSTTGTAASGSRERTSTRTCHSGLGS